MGFAIKGQLTGLDDVMRALRAVETKVQRQIIRKAITAAGKPMAAEAKRLCPVDTNPHNPVRGLLKKSIGTKTKTYRGSGVVVLIIGPRGGFRRQQGVRKRGKYKGQAYDQDPINIAHLVEYGTKRAKAKPFMRPAYDRNKARAETIFAQVAREELAKR